jgi:5-methylcytosine-specific restriction endonuclease McrA
MNDLKTCPICGRVIPKKHETKHHLIPKSRGGTIEDVVILHKSCHRHIHAVLTEKELERDYNTIDKLKAHPEVKKFIRFIRKQRPDFTSRSRKKKR